MRPGCPDHARFEGRVGRVVTVNCGGRALVDFADGAWYDLPATAEVLDVVTAEDAKGRYDPSANMPRSFPRGKAERATAKG